MTAVATDNSGGSTTSAPRSVTVTQNSLPSISLDAPASGATYREPATIGLSATAPDSDGTVVRVDFFAGSVLIGSAAAPPFTATWTNVGPGSYSLTARATDNAGGIASSPAVSIIVNANAHPTISLTAPTNNATYYAPATITVGANAADSDGSVTRVDFYANGSLIGSDTSSPYSVIWDEVAGGTYTLTAVVTDDGGATTPSAGVNVSVSPAPLVTILEPVVDPTYGVAAGNGSIYVRGLVDAPLNSSVVVNGQRAVIDDSGQFHANNVPLGSNSTTVTVTVTTQDGRTSSESISVLNAGPAAFTVQPDAAQGLGSKDVVFTTTDHSNGHIQRFEYDFTSNGTVDYTVNASSFVNGQYEFSLTYGAPGRYVATVKAYDAQNTPVQTVRYAIVIKDPGTLDTMLRGVYGQMLDRLRVGNIDGALTAVTAGGRGRYRDVFLSLQSDLLAMVDQSRDIAEGNVSEDIAEYVIVRAAAGGDQAFFTYFVRCEDGVWRIDGM